MANTTQAGSSWQTALWPADVIHVNEDGWVAINRGLAHGVMVGMRLLVIGSGVREVRDLFNGNPNAPESASVEKSVEKSVVLRTRRTYELLEVVYVEQESAIAIATRAPLERRPEFYRGPDGELLVWVPLPKDYTWPPANGDDGIDSSDGANTSANDAYSDYGYAQSDDAEEESDDDEESATANDDAAPGADEVDAPNERIAQEDERWEESLPLNGVSVGDRVTPAIPATHGEAIPSHAPPPAGAPVAEEPAGHHTESVGGAASGPTYDWLKPLS